MRYFAGIDMGSTAIKIILVDEEGRRAGQSVSSTGSLFKKNTTTALSLLLRERGIASSDVAYTLSTATGESFFTMPTRR